jgi:hypothetical protein
MLYLKKSNVQARRFRGVPVSEFGQMTLKDNYRGLLHSYLLQYFQPTIYSHGFIPHLTLRIADPTFDCCLFQEIRGLIGC